MTYFQDSEFQCKCGKCPIKSPDPALLSRLNGLRSAYGKSLYITSGWRCEPHNTAVGGVIDSAHLVGKAADIFCTNSHDRFNLLFHALGMFNRIGIGTTIIHVDVDDTKPQEVIWLYGTH